MNIFTTPYTKEIIMDKIKKGEWDDILNKLCVIKDNTIFLDYIYFKYFASKQTYSILTNYMINNINTILTEYDEFIVYVNMKSLTITEVDKHMNYMTELSLVLKDTYTNKLKHCYIYNPPFIISKVLQIIYYFIDAETQRKIVVVPTEAK